MNKFFNFKTLVSFSALLIAACAALFSVTGIGKLFAGAAVSAMVMASALELGKLVGVSFLYRYWEEIPKALKSYMSIASVVLILITSAGIYGYLSSAYAKVAAEPLKMNADIQIYNSQATTLDEEKLGAALIVTGYFAVIFESLKIDMKFLGIKCLPKITIMYNLVKQ